MKYVIKREGVFDDYVLMVADIVYCLADTVEWNMSQTDCLQDATKFTSIREAFWAVDLLGLDEEEWGVVSLES
ncbi:hypothetical protein VPHF99_0257 [Vibrio phage F99]|nr:hypothetical protein MYOV056v2_p0224 [Vibrio phage 184E37.3a]QZI87175.1 hypothetical protein MYOV085v1_p0156 [Vibrio phage 355E48.1]QZI90080.1 hypothetical protein MYOV057v1_p0165 [Vibrio phage 184E37.1]